MNSSTLNRFLLFLLISSLVCTTFFSKEITSRVYVTKCKLGDVIDYGILLRECAGKDVEYKRVGNKYFDIFLRDVKVVKRGRDLEVLYKIQPFFLGKKKLPVIPVFLNGEKINYSPPILEVVSTVGKSLSPKPLKPPYKVVIKRWYGRLAFIPLFLFFIVIFLFFRFRKKKREIVEIVENVEEFEGDTTSEIIRKIEALKKGRIYEKDSRYFAFLLSQFLRELLSKHFSVDFLKLTNEEIKEFFDSQNHIVRGELIWILNSCEMVEFSPQIFESSFFEKMVDVALKISGHFVE